VEGALTTDGELEAAPECGDKRVTGCAEEAAGPGPRGEAVPAGETEDGRPVLHAGGAFSDAPVVAVEALLADPRKWAGKTVVVEGDISAMCHHKRGWFAMVAGDKSGQQLRVITLPAFHVPPESIGRVARAEGTVEVIELDAAHAQHLAAEHKVGGDEMVQGGAVKQVVLRAGAADFIEVAAR
jgi:hypothetical protein